MASTTNRLLASRSSFRKRDWELSNYPVVVCENEANLRPAKQRYFALIPNWNVGGAGQSEAEALQALEKNFAKVKAKKISSGGSIPRPGAQVPVDMKSWVDGKKKSKKTISQGDTRRSRQGNGEAESG